jgi:N-acetylglutamate synthase-like GNAT family acetyltransferase
MQIKTAKPSDIAALHALVESAYRGDSAKQGWTHEADLLGGQRTDSEGLGAIIDDPQQAILIAEDDARMIGCVQLSQVDGDTAYLGLLTVDPKEQAGGYGKQILAAAEQYARENMGASAMEMTVIRQRAELIAYYQRRGYDLTGEQRPFPLDNPRFGLPKSQELEFIVLRKPL